MRFDEIAQLLLNMLVQSAVSTCFEMSIALSSKMPNKSVEGDKKSWRKINRERKILKRQHKQENLIKKLEKIKKLEEITKSVKDEEKAPKKPVSTVSIAVPGSILENAQSAELRTYLAGQIARAACIFRVDEVVIFDDVGINNMKQTRISHVDGEEGTEAVRNSCLQLARILQYLECPQYLRKFFFPLHKDLKYSGLLNPLDAPHHLRQHNTFIYREGVVIEKKAKEGKGSYVNVGLLNDVLADKPLTPGLRVTIRIDEQNVKKMKGVVVSPSEPRQMTGIYWGYTVRIAHSISEIFTKSPYQNGYDLTIGTSDKGSNINNVQPNSLKYNHALVVFGGLKGLETALEMDEKLTVDDPKLLFDEYLNVLPAQGSRTVRTEEAILITLSALQGKLRPEVEDIEFDFKEYIPQSEDTGVKPYANVVPSDVDLSKFD